MIWPCGSGTKLYALQENCFNLILLSFAVSNCDVVTPGSGVVLNCIVS